MPTTYRRKTGPKDDDSKPHRGRPIKEKNEVTSELVATGEATMAQIAGLFNTDAKTLPTRLKGLVPRGHRRGYKVYSIRQAASRLVEPGYEIEEFIRQMSPQELPPLLSKEFWNGQNARLKHERELGNLWPTQDVAELIGNDLLALVRMTILLIPDDVDREASLTEEQRIIVRRICDGLIDTLREKIVERFKDFHANRAPTQLADEDDDDPLVAYDDSEDDEPEYPDDIETAVAEDDDDGNILAAEDDEEEDIGI